MSFKTNACRLLAVAALTLPAVSAFAQPSDLGPGNPSNNVPEPGTLVLAGLAVVGAIASRRKNK